MIEAITPFQGWNISIVWFPGATRFALAPGYHIPRRWRTDSCICTLCKSILGFAAGAGSGREGREGDAGKVLFGVGGD